MCVVVMWEAQDSGFAPVSQRDFFAHEKEPNLQIYKDG
jgi:hypothetical protein